MFIFQGLWATLNKDKKNSYNGGMLMFNRQYEAMSVRSPDISGGET